MVDDTIMLVLRYGRVGAALLVAFELEPKEEKNMFLCREQEEDIDDTITSGYLSYFL